MIVAAARTVAFLVPFEVEIVVMNSGGSLPGNLMLASMSV